MVPRCTLQLFLLISAATAARLPPKANLLAPAEAIPSWACAMPGTEAERLAKALSPNGIHKLFATGNASHDLEEAASIELAAERLEKEEASKVKGIVAQATDNATAAKREAKEASELDEAAKKELERNTTNATKAANATSKNAIAKAKEAQKASERAQALIRDAEAMEDIAQGQGNQMFAIAAELRKEASDEAKQSVQAVNGDTLKGLMAKEDLLVVFYAPWCPHCQTYVMHDASGNAENAPVEKLNQELHQSGGPHVVKFNVDEGTIPQDFDVKYIPALYYTNTDGQRLKFTGEPEDFNAIKDFAAVQHKAEMKLAKVRGPIVTVLKELDKAAVLGRLRKREMKA